MAEKVKTTLYFDGHAVSKSQKFFLVIAALTYAFDLMDVAIFGIVSPILVENYGLTNENISNLTFIFFVGSMLGATFGGIMADKIGRKKAMLLNIMIFSLASLANALWQPHYFMLLEISRFATGFGTMAAVSVAVAYISEMLPAEKRGKYQSLTLGAGTFSVPFVAVLAATVATASAESWRYVFAIGAAMLLLVPVAIKYLEESPRYLISKGKVKEAEDVMQRCLGFECDMSEAYENYSKSVANYKKISFDAQMKILFGKQQRRQTLVCLMFALCLGCGNNMMMNYNNVFLVEMGFPLATVLLVGALTAFGQPVGELLSSLFSDKGGRTLPIFFYCGIAGIISILLGFITSPLQYGVLQFIKTLFTAGAMALLMTYIPESFPTSVRSSATGYIYAIQRIVIAFTAYLVLACYNAGGWLYCMIANAAFWLVAAFVILFFGKRTAMQNIDAMHTECALCEDEEK